MLTKLKSIFSKKQKEVKFSLEESELTAICEMLESAFQQVVDDYKAPIKIDINWVRVKETFGFKIEVTDKEILDRMVH